MKQPFQIGDRVQCSFLPSGSPPSAVTVIRTVAHVEKVGDGHTFGKVTSSGWLVSADGGIPCAHCGATAPAIPMIDSGYYEVVLPLGNAAKETPEEESRRRMQAQLEKIEAQGAP